MYNMNFFRERCDVLLQQAKNQNDVNKITILEEIKEELKNDNFFLSGNDLLIYYILDILGFDKEQTTKIINYFKDSVLVDVILQYEDNNGKLVNVETSINPKYEICYKFDNDLLFKYNKLEDNYYSYLDGKWVLNNIIENKFYDFHYNYQKVSFKKK